MSEIKSHESVSGLQYSQHHSGVSLCSGVRLHVGILCSEEFLDSLDGECLNFVNDLATAVISLSRVTLSVFVRKPRTHCLHHLVADEVFRCDKFHTLELTLVFSLDQIENLLVFFHMYKYLR